MKDSYRRIRVVLVMVIKESIRKLTLLLRQHKKRKSSKDMVTSLMENSESVRRKSKLWLTPSTI